MSKHLLYLLDNPLRFVFPNTVFQQWDMFPSSGVMVHPQLGPWETRSQSLWTGWRKLNQFPKRRFSKKRGVGKPWTVSRPTAMFVVRQNGNKHVLFKIPSVCTAVCLCSFVHLFFNSHALEQDAFSSWGLWYAHWSVLLAAVLSECNAIYGVCVCVNAAEKCLCLYRMPMTCDILSCLQGFLQALLTDQCTAQTGCAETRSSRRNFSSSHGEKCFPSLGATKPFKGQCFKEKFRTLIKGAENKS